MGENEHDELTIIAPETVVRERLDFIVKEILQYSFPTLQKDALLWRDSKGLRHVHCETERELSIGRDMNCTIVLADDFASRTHATIRRKGEEWVVFDEQSKNGTWLNNHPVDTACLHSGDILRVGNSYLVYMEASLAGLESMDDSLHMEG